MTRLAAFIALLITASLVQADTLHLRDGRVMNGTFMSGTSREVRFLPEGGRAQTYAINDISNVTFGVARVTTSNSSTGTGVNADSARARSARYTVPSGTVVTVSMIDSIDSDATGIGKTYRASLDDPLVVNGQTVANRGADAKVRVARVEQSGRLTGKEEITLELAEITVDGRPYAVSTSNAEIASKSKGSETAKVVGGTAVVGAIIGAIAGGGKGAAIGAATGAGAGAAIQAIRGQRVQVASESHLDFTLSQPLYIE